MIHPAGSFSIGPDRGFLSVLRSKVSFLPRGDQQSSECMDPKLCTLCGSGGVGGRKGSTCWPSNARLEQVAGSREGVDSQSSCFLSQETVEYILSTALGPSVHLSPSPSEEWADARSANETASIFREGGESDKEEGEEEEEEGQPLARVRIRAPGGGRRGLMCKCPILQNWFLECHVLLAMDYAPLCDVFGIMCVCLWVLRLYVGGGGLDFKLYGSLSDHFWGINRFWALFLFFQGHEGFFF